MKFDKFAKILEDRVKSLKLPSKLKDERDLLKQVFDFFRSKTNTGSILRNAFEKNVDEKDRKLFEKLLATEKYIGEDEIQYILMSLIIERNKMFPPEGSETTDADTVDADDTGEQEEEEAEEEEEDPQSMDEKLKPDNFRILYKSKKSGRQYSNILYMQGQSSIKSGIDKQNYRIVFSDYEEKDGEWNMVMSNNLLVDRIALDELKNKIENETSLTKIKKLEVNGEKENIYILYFDPNNKLDELVEKNNEEETFIDELVKNLGIEKKELKRELSLQIPVLYKLYKYLKKILPANESKNKYKSPGGITDITPGLKSKLKSDLNLNDETAEKVKKFVDNLEYRDRQFLNDAIKFLINEGYIKKFRKMFGLPDPKEEEDSQSMDLSSLFDQDEDPVSERLIKLIKPLIREKLKRKQNGKKNLCN
tara:strand:+ start:1712 stop:2974 length:1263 start_codon:yes stop_codon:yes gene_type:complete